MYKEGWVFYFVGIWLNGLVKFRVKDGMFLFVICFQNLSKGIMDEDLFVFCLGGSLQDKFCVSMLFNNYFFNV